jgi:O-antigen/teichoic acid export membrane protein
MFRKIIGTIGTRLIGAILALIINVLNARYLGATNVGTIYLIILSVTYIQLFNNFIGGGALVYMTPRADFFKLFVSSYAWTLFITGISTFLFEFLGSFGKHFEIIPHGYFFHVLFLALIMSLTSVNYMLLLGKEKVRVFNIINLAQTLILVGFLLSGIYLFHLRNVMTYYWAILFSYIIAYMISLYLVFPYLGLSPLRGLKPIFKTMFRFGTYALFANIFQQMNYRLGLYIVDVWYGRASVGVLAIGFSLSEGLWIVSRSLALVQFARISNSRDLQYSVKLTLTLSKIAMAITTLSVLCLVAIPAFVYRKIFGPEFGMIRLVIASLGLGIITLSLSMVLSPFFSGINKVYHNMISSAIGLIFTVVLGFLLIPRFGIIGASITASISYTASMIYQFIIFSRMSHLGIKDFILTKGEIKLLVSETRNFLNREKS